MRRCALTGGCGALFVTEGRGTTRKRACLRPVELVRPSLAAAEALDSATRCRTCWHPSVPAMHRPHGLDRSDGDRPRSGHVSQPPGSVARRFEPAPEDHSREGTDDPHADYDEADFRDIHLPTLRQDGLSATHLLKRDRPNWRLAKAMRTWQDLGEHSFCQCKEWRER